MPAEAKTLFKEQLAARFNYVEQHLSKQDYLLGEGFTIADAYLFVTTGWAGSVGVSLEPWPAIRAFRERVSARPAVRTALQAEGSL
jgi:glutathione S-transferase